MVETSNRDQKKFGSSLALYVIVIGWVGALIFTALLIEHKSTGYVLNSFLSPEQAGLRFRVLIFFIPLMATVIGFLLYERDKNINALLARKQEVDRANIQLEEMIRQKDLFLVRLGHDLKTPITPLVTLLPLVRDREQDAKQKELLDVAVENINTLKDLVIKSLKLARVKSSKELKLEEFGLKEETDKVLRKREQYVDEQNLKISNRIERDIMVRADRVEFEELMYNLVSNGIKYSLPASAIHIEAEPEGEYIRISVIDTGVGLTESQVKHVFDEFYKVDESRHELDSSGLGLSICKNIVKNHGGEIRAMSEGLGKGTTISFTLPQRG